MAEEQPGTRSPYESVWNQTMKRIRGELGEQEFAWWFNMRYTGATESAVIVSMPSTFLRDHIQQEYQEYIESILRELVGKELSLVIEVKPALSAEITPEDEPDSAAAERPAERSGGGSAERPRQAAPVEPKKPHTQLNGRYTFDSYIISDANTFPANAAQAVARNPGTTYNPLLLYGGVGLGKTHLMQAIGNYAHGNSTGKIIYVTAEQFTNEFILSMRENSQPSFKNKYRYVDFLLIDDIHFFQNKEGVQEVLFHTYDSLYNDNKQLVFTCDRPISELKNLTARLKSRFERGLPVELQMPDYEARCAILKSKTDIMRVTVPDEVVELVAKNISSNVRELEAALTKLVAYAELVGKSITIEIARQQLKDVFATPRQANLTIETIQKVIAEKFGLSFNDLKGKKRTANIVWPRQLAMYICREITEYSTTEIGQYFGGKDHTTVMHACKKIEDILQTDPSMEPTIQNLVRAIKEYSAKM